MAHPWLRISPDKTLVGPIANRLFVHARAPFTKPVFYFFRAHTLAECDTFVSVCSCFPYFLDFPRILRVQPQVRPGVGEGLTRDEVKTWKMANTGEVVVRIFDKPRGKGQKDKHNKRKVVLFVGPSRTKL